MKVTKQVRQLERAADDQRKAIVDERAALRRFIDRRKRRIAKIVRRLKPLRRKAAKIEAVRDGLGQHAEVIVSEAHAAGLELALACALVEQESLGRNIFGCDLGSRSSVPFCHQPVTRERVVELLAHLRRGGTGNGVGLTQLTSSGFVFDAEESGGAHKPSAQCEVGFDLLKSLIAQVGEFKGIGAYNGGLGNPIASYADEVLERRARYRKLLA